MSRKNERRKDESMKQKGTLQGMPSSSSVANQMNVQTMQDVKRASE